MARINGVGEAKSPMAKLIYGDVDNSTKHQSLFFPGHDMHDTHTHPHTNAQDTQYPTDKF